MTEKSIPWAGKVLGDAGPYDFDEWTQIWRDLFGAELWLPHASGVIPGHAPTLATNSAATPVTVGALRALVDGTWYESDADSTVTVATPSGSTRPDLLVLRKSDPDQTVRLTLVQGNEGDAQPPNPTQSRGSTWDLPIAVLSTTTGGAITMAPAFPVLGTAGPAGHFAYAAKLLLEDFTGLIDDISGSSILFAESPWDVNLTNTGSVDVSTADNAAVGQIRLATGATVNSVVEVQRGREVSGQFDCGWDLACAMRVRDEATPVQKEFACGVRSRNAGAVDATDGIYLKFDHGASEENWEGITRVGGSETSTDLGALSDGNWHTVEFRKWGHEGSLMVQWYVDGAAVGSAVSTNIPTESDFVVPAVFLENTAGANKTVDVDFLDVALVNTAANGQNPATTADRGRLLNVTA